MTRYNFGIGIWFDTVGKKEQANRISPRLSELNAAQRSTINQLIEELANGNKKDSTVKQLAKEIQDLA